LGTVHFVRPQDGKKRYVTSRWRVWGVLFGIPAMLFAGLWLHAFLATLLTLALGVAAEQLTGLREGDPNYLITYIPGWVAIMIYGGFIPRLRIRKYERLGWQRVETQ